jgi:hypothetical protein
MIGDVGETPMLYDDADKASAEALRTSVVAKAHLSGWILPPLAIRTLEAHKNST